MFLFVMNTPTKTIPYTTGPCTYILRFGFAKLQPQMVIGYTSGKLRSRVSGYKNEFNKKNKEKPNSIEVLFYEEFSKYSSGNKAKRFETFLINLLGAVEDVRFKNKQGGADTFMYGDLEEFLKIVVDNALLTINL